MGMVIAILKCIGIVLLAVLGLALFLCAAVIFIPVRYVVRCSTGASIYVGFSASWLLHVVRLQKKLSEPDVHLYVFGFDVTNIKKRFRKGERKPQTSHSTKQAGGIVDDMDEGEQQRKKAEQKEMERIRENIHTDYEETPEGRAFTDGGGGKENVKGKRKKSFSFDRISSIITFIRGNEHRSGIRKVKKEVAALVKYLSPRHVKGSIAFGTGDPCTTGWALGLISMFPAAYTDGLSVSPDFEEKKLDVNAYVRGRIRVLYFLRLFLRGYMDEETKTVLRKASELFNQ